MPFFIDIRNGFAKARNETNNIFLLLTAIGIPL